MNNMESISVLVILLGLGLNFPTYAIRDSADSLLVHWEKHIWQNVFPENSGELRIFCYKSKIQQSLWSLWTTVQFNIDGESSDFTIYKGPDIESVKEECKNESTLSIWSIIRPWVTSGSISINPFNNTCIGITGTSNRYTVIGRIIDWDYWKLACTLAGLILFFTAPQLSGNIVCYYTAGISFGVLASALIIVFMLSKFIPRKSGAYLFLTAGFSLSAYILQTVWSHAADILQKHWLYLCAYFIVAGLISFAVCYYKGPVTNPRLLSLIQWTLQLISIGLIYAGCQIPYVSATTIVLCVLMYNLPHVPWTWGLWNAMVTFWRRMFPPKIRLLTEEQYNEQGRIETEKALAELREFCNSPKCNAWKTMSCLKTPDRFALWASGNSLHLTDDEIIEHDLDPSPRPNLDLVNRFDPDDMGEDFDDDRHSQSMMLPSSSRYGNQVASGNSSYSNPVARSSYNVNRSMDSTHGFQRSTVRERDYSSSSFTSRR